MGADPQSRLGTEFLEIVETKFFACVDDLMADGFGRAEINKFIDLVHDAAFTHELQRQHAAAHGADGQAVGARATKHIIACFTPAAAFHIFRQHRRISRYMLA